MWMVSILVWSTLHLASLQQTNESCQSKNGNCKPLRDCPWGKKAIQQGVRPDICRFLGVEPIICCLEDKIDAGSTVEVSTTEASPPVRKDDSTNERISQKKCREYAQYVFEIIESPLGLGSLNQSTCKIEAEPLIVGGVPASPREFPHMALIGYESRSQSAKSKISWQCGGSLISDNFVLSAAHCSNPRGPATWVKLGELDKSTENDDADPITIRIAERIDHPDYKPPRVYNDISLFRLQERVVLSSYIRPICLHDGRDLPHKVVASGWGNIEHRGKSSEALQKVKIDIVSQESCSNSYSTTRGSWLPDGITGQTQLCAGEKGKDTCQGDSGGPLQMVLADPYCMYMQIGITSFGKGCGTHPGVYTRVSSYLDWIEKIVWPNTY